MLTGASQVESTRLCAELASACMSQAAIATRRQRQDGPSDEAASHRMPERIRGAPAGRARSTEFSDVKLREH